MVFPRPSSPAAAWRDLKAFLNERGRHRLLFGVIAVLMPVLIVSAFYVDSTMKKKPRMVYVEVWPANRTDEQIKAEQKVDQARREAEARERQRQYQRLADQLGIDTDE